MMVPPAPEARAFTMPPAIKYDTYATATAATTNQPKREKMPSMGTVYRQERAVNSEFSTICVLLPDARSLRTDNPATYADIAVIQNERLPGRCDMRSFKDNGVL